MLHKPIELLEIGDLKSLVANAVPEGLTLDYKQAIPGEKYADKKDFLADVSSFANASGGYILFGVTERRDGEGKTTGIPEEVTGIDGLNSDHEIRRLEQMATLAVEPRMPGLRLRAVNGGTRGPVLALYVPKSWASPHVVTLENHYRFYSRRSAAKYPMDVQELRAAFLASAAVTERIGRFIDARVKTILAGGAPLPLAGTARAVVHLVPVGSMDPGAQIDLVPFMRGTNQLEPIYPSGRSKRPNFDGVVSYSETRGQDHAGICTTYVQLFRNGIVEAVETDLMNPGPGRPKLIPSGIFEPHLVKSIGQYLPVQKTFGLAPPIFVVITLLNASDLSFISLNRSWSSGPAGHRFGCNLLRFPEVLLDSYDVDIARAMRPIFDAMWQAAGFERSQNYDSDGNWEPYTRVS